MSEKLSYPHAVETLRREITLSRGFWILFILTSIGLLLYSVRAVITPILLAFLIAYVLDPVVDRLERLKIPRVLGVLIVLVAVLGTFMLFFTLVVPSIVRDIISFARELPRHTRELLERVEPIFSRYGIQIPHSTSEAIEALSGRTEELTSKVATPLGGALKWLIGGTVSALGAAAAALLVPVLAFYLLNDFDKLIRSVHALVPLKWHAPLKPIVKEINFVLGKFMRGQVTVMAILAVLYGGAYAAMGVRLAIPIGIMSGILNFIPYVGSAFALVAGLLMSLLGGWHPWQLLGVVLCYAVVQSLEGFVITPKIVGKTVGLSDLWVLLALFVSGEIFGFLGVLLAVPAAAVLKIFVMRGVNYYRSTTFYTDSEPRPGSWIAGVLYSKGISEQTAAPIPEPLPIESKANSEAINIIGDAPNPDPAPAAPEALESKPSEISDINSKESKDPPKEIESKE